LRFKKSKSAEKQTLLVFNSRLFPLIVLFQGDQPALQTHLSRIQQPFSHHPQVRQCEQGRLLGDVFRQATKAYFRVAKLALDHAKGMFNLGPHLRFGVFDLASHTPDQTLFSVLSIAAGTRGNRPNPRAVLMLSTLLHTGITRIAAHVSFLTMQQLIDLSDVRHIRRRAHQAVHQAC
jgi:hypothetical protein